MKTTQQKEVFIEAGRDLAAAILKAEVLNNEYVATDAGNVLVDGDFIGTNAGIVKNDFVALFGSEVMTPLLAILDTVGVKTVLQGLKSVD